MSHDRFANVLYEQREGAAWITINRPAKLNALDRRTVTEIVSAVDDAVADPGVGVLVFTGAGDKAFVAGADIAEMAILDAAEAQEFARLLQRAFDRVEQAPKPAIAAVNGFALGGGCELALACHLRFAADSAHFGQPEVGLGLIPGAGGTQRLPRIVGRGRALDLLLSGEMVDAAEAYRMGLAQRVVPRSELRTTVDAYVTRLRRNSPIAMSRVLEAVLAGAECSQADALRFEAALFGLSFATADMREGTRAFAEKRRPLFEGR